MHITDADALGFLESQLTHIEATLWRRKFAPIIYQDLIPVSNEAGEYATSITIRHTDGFTKGKFIGSQGRDVPMTRVGAGQTIVPVEYAGIGFEYSMQELRQSAHLNIPLDAEQAILARRGFEEHAQEVAFFGSAPHNMTGLFNNPNVATGAAASTIDAALAGANPGDAVAAIINEAINAVIVNSKMVEIPDRVLLPTDQFTKIASTRLGSVSDTTILDFVREKNAATAALNRPIEIRAVPHLDASDTMVVYASNPDVMVYHIPLTLRFTPPQQTGLMVQVFGEYSLSGVEIRFPAAVTYRTGI